MSQPKLLSQVKAFGQSSKVNLERLRKTLLGATDWATLLTAVWGPYNVQNLALYEGQWNLHGTQEKQERWSLKLEPTSSTNCNLLTIVPSDSAQHKT